MPNRSLDDFVGGGEEETSDADTEAESSDAETEAAGDEVSESEADTTDAAETEAVAAEADVEETEAEVDDETEADGETEPTLTVEEATPTYDFSPDGSTCEACGETVQTRWHDADQGMVCADCKRWD